MRRSIYYITSKPGFAFRAQVERKKLIDTALAKLDLPMARLAMLPAVEREALYSKTTLAPHVSAQVEYTVYELLRRTLQENLARYLFASKSHHYSSTPAIPIDRTTNDNYGIVEMQKLEQLLSAGSSRQSSETNKALEQSFRADNADLIRELSASHKLYRNLLAATSVN